MDASRQAANRRRRTACSTRGPLTAVLSDLLGESQPAIRAAFHDAVNACIKISDCHFASVSRPKKCYLHVLLRVLLQEVACGQDFLVDN
jgi:hypothetical protein